MMNRFIGALCCVLILLCGVSFAASDDISRLYTITSGQTITSSGMNSEFNQLVTTMNTKAGRGVNNTMTGDNTFSGTNTFSGSNTFSHSSGVTTNTITERSAGTGVTADSVLLKDGNINVGAAGYAPAAAGDFGYDETSYKFMVMENSTAYNVRPDYIQLRDEKSSGTDGGGSTSGSWQTRVLNTEVSDLSSLCSLSSNQFTLTAGTYYISASAPFYRGDASQIRLYNATDASAILVGTNTGSVNSAVNATVRSQVNGVFTIGASKALEIQYRVGTSKTNDGLGQATSWGTEVYAVVELWRLK